MKENFASFKSIFFDVLPLRAFVILVFIVVMGCLLLGLYILNQFSAASQLSLRHQGILLAKALEAGISPDAEKENIQGLQESVNRFVSAQENDIEVNIMLLKRKESYTVASNIADNLEQTSKEEHQDLLTSLKSGRPVFFISEGEDEEGEEEDDDADKEKEGNRPHLAVDGKDPYDFPDNRRFMSITTPIIVNEKGIGSINVKLSLVPLDQKLSKIRLGIWTATFFEAILVLIGLLYLFNYFLKEKNRLQEKETLRLKAELKAFQSQVNPHFLFNTLNTLSHLIATDPLSAEKMTSDMAFLFRNVVGAGKKEWWTIEEEMKVIKTYLEIESVRLCDRLKFYLDISKEVTQIKIPCLLIQPLVENSVKHGISASPAGGEIKIRIFRDKDLFFSVEDMRYPSEKYPTASYKDGEKSGIENIKKRLELFYADQARFEFQIFKDGAKAEITICGNAYE